MMGIVYSIGFTQFILNTARYVWFKSACNKNLDSHQGGIKQVIANTCCVNVGSSPLLTLWTGGCQAAGKPLRVAIEKRGVEIMINSTKITMNSPLKGWKSTMKTNHSSTICHLLFVIPGMKTKNIHEPRVTEVNHASNSQLWKSISWANLAIIP